VSLGLSAPAAVPVEVRAGEHRAFRLSTEIGEGGLRLGKPAPFEPGRPVEVRFALPDGGPAYAFAAEVIATGDEAEGDGSIGGCGLDFLDVPPDVRDAIKDYVARRLGLPRLP
jgi:hypothetical protein